MKFLKKYTQIIESEKINWGQKAASEIDDFVSQIKAHSNFYTELDDAMDVISTLMDWGKLQIENHVLTIEKPHLSIWVNNLSPYFGAYSNWKKINSGLSKIEKFKPKLWWGMLVIINELPDNKETRQGLIKEFGKIRADLESRGWLFRNPNLEKYSFSADRPFASSNPGFTGVGQFCFEMMLPIDSDFVFKPSL
jgi:hypothetical protein